MLIMQAHAGMSRTTLYLKLTALTGLSISRYVRSLRLSKAQELLAVSTFDIAKVGYAVGLNNPKYFSRVFLSELGFSPGIYRQSARS